MPTHLSCRAIFPALIGALALSMSLAGLAEAKAPKTIPAALRVVDSSGRILAQQTQLTTDARFRSDPDADCFGSDSGGSGQPVTVPGPTALGQVYYGSKITRSLRPVSVTDAFSFGLGICGIGNAISPSTGFWYVKQNHVATTTGADQVEVGKRDSILWYLISDFTQPTPDELELKLARKPRDGSIRVAVRSYADDGTRSPAVGVSVSGASQPTDARGRTTVQLDGRITRVQATREGSIPSAVEQVCGVGPRRCPYGYAAVVGGTSKADRITSGATAVTIRAGGGRDRIRVRRGKSRVKVDCGRGKDVLRISRSRSARSKSCERVRRTR